MEYNLQKYIALVTAVDCGSITAASEKLNYSQSGISRMIHDLEQEWSITLLERMKSGVSLTADGARLMPYIRTLCRAFDNLNSGVNAIRGVEVGRIRIGTFSSVAAHLLPPLMAAFRERYPDVDFELLTGNYSDIETWVREGRCDLGFVRLPAEGEFEEIPVLEDGQNLILPPGHPLAEQETVSLRDIAREPFILLAQGEDSDVMAWFEANGVKPAVEYSTWDDYAVMSMVESGLGISILPETILRRCPYNVAVRDIDPPSTRRIGIILKDRETASVAAKKFLDLLSDQLPDQMMR